LQIVDHKRSTGFNTWHSLDQLPVIPLGHQPLMAINIRVPKMRPCGTTHKQGNYDERNSAQEAGTWSGNEMQDCGEEQRNPWDKSHCKAALEWRTDINVQVRQPECPASKHKPCQPHNKCRETKSVMLHQGFRIIPVLVTFIKEQHDQDKNKSYQ